MNAAPAALPVIHTLLCHTHVPMALRCLDSLRRCHEPAFLLQVTDDGTLTDEDCARLAEALPGTAFRRRADTDGSMRERLAKYPACWRYRQTSPMALKAMDLPLLGTEPLVVCDSDIFFVRRFTGFHRLLDPAQPLIFTQDLTMAYAIRYWHLLGRDRLRLMSRLNAGVMIIQPQSLDLGFMEWVLARLGPASNHHLVEQTYWAAEAARQGGCRYLSPRQIGYPPPDAKAPGALPLPPGRVGVHFISPLRRWLDRLDEEAVAATRAEAPVDLETIPARLLRVPSYVAWRVGKQFRSWQGKPL